MNYDLIIKKTKLFVDTYLLPIIFDIGKNIEDDFFMDYLSTSCLNDSIIKQKNIILLANKINDKEILEIGFNNGFSTLLFLNSNPNIIINCIDNLINKYTLPCYNKIREFYGNRINLIIGESLEIMPKMRKFFDLIYINNYNDLSNIVKEDIINSFYRGKNDAIIILNNNNNLSELIYIWIEIYNIYKFINIDFDIFENSFHCVKN